VDAAGNVWTIDLSVRGGAVAVNGVDDPVTSHVIELAYVNGVIWQEYQGKLWWGKTSPSGTWLPLNGTAVNPLASYPLAMIFFIFLLCLLFFHFFISIFFVIYLTFINPSGAYITQTSGGAIIDNDGNVWKIDPSTDGGAIVVNGVVDPASWEVTVIAYVNGLIWQEDSLALWWSKTSLSADWVPTGGTTLNPLASYPTLKLLFLWHFFFDLPYPLWLLHHSLHRWLAHGQQLERLDDKHSCQRRSSCRKWNSRSHNFQSHRACLRQRTNLARGQ
jgi:hypothetical protein